MSVLLLLIDLGCSPLVISGQLDEWNSCAKIHRLMYRCRVKRQTIAVCGLSACAPAAGFMLITYDMKAWPEYTDEHGTSLWSSYNVGWIDGAMLQYHMNSTPSKASSRLIKSSLLRASAST